MYLHLWKPDVTKTTTNFEINLSAITNIFLSFDIDSARICLFPGLIVATQSQTCSNPTLKSLINNKFRYPFAFRRYPLRMIFLNPSVSDWNVISFDKTLCLPLQLLFVLMINLKNRNIEPTLYIHKEDRLLFLKATMK